MKSSMLSVREEGRHVRGSRDGKPYDPDDMDIWAFNPYMPDVALGPLTVTGPAPKDVQGQGATAAAP